MSVLRELAEKASDAGDFEKAFRFWDRLAREERDPMGYCQAGYAAQKLGRWIEAWHAYKQALTIDANCAEAMGLLGFLSRKRTDRNRTANLLEAKEWYLRAIKIDRKPRWLFFLGTTCGELKEISAAIEALKEAVALRPTYEEAYLNLALLYLHECNNARAARKYLTKAIKIDPNYAEAILNLALISKRKSPKKARELLEKVVAIDPKNAEAIFNLAVLTERKYPDRAQDLFERTIEINPNYAEAHQQLGNLLYKKRQLVEAEYHFKRALEIDPADYFSHLFLADLLAFQQRDQEAESAYRAAIALPQAGPEGYEFFANFLDWNSRHLETNEIRRKKGETGEKPGQTPHYPDLPSVARERIRK